MQSMHFPQLIGRLLAAGTVLLAAIALGQEIQGHPKLPTADLGIPPEVLEDRSILWQDFGPTIAGSSLIGREIIDRYKNRVGKVIDLLIDPWTAELPLVLVEMVVQPETPAPQVVPQARGEAPPARRPQAQPEKRHAKHRPVAFPAASLDLLADPQGYLHLVGDRGDAALLSPRELSETLTREWLVERSLERTDLESWRVAVHVPSREDPQAAPHPQNHYPLLRFSQLQNQAVQGEHDVPLGKIVDVAVATQHRRVPYAAVALADDPSQQLYQVPLLALVAEEGQPWRIELSESRVKIAPKIDPQHWPTTIGRGWHEYVSERYNTNPRDGVELQKATPPARGKP
jgi:hypothetical protein